MLPISDALNRYSIGKSTLYTWLKKLGISPYNKGKRSYILNEHLPLLDELSVHLKSGGLLNDFQQSSNKHPLDAYQMTAELISDDQHTSTELPLDDQHTLATQPSDETVDWLEAIGAIASAISPPNPISHWERLQWLCEQRIIISTTEVSKLTGAKPRGEIGRRGSFKFVKCDRIGGQLAWRVQRVQLSSDEPALNG